MFRLVLDRERKLGKVTVVWNSRRGSAPPSARSASVCHMSSIVFNRGFPTRLHQCLRHLFSLTQLTFSFGRAGVECYCQHESGAAVIQLQFLINEVRLVSSPARLSTMSRLCVFTF